MKIYPQHETLGGKADVQGHRHMHVCVRISTAAALAAWGRWEFTAYRWLVTELESGHQ